MTTLGLRDLGFLAAATPVTPLWTPADISTVLWLDAADSSTITTVSGSVNQWNDKSGNGRNVSSAAVHRPTLSEAAYRPTLVANNLNGYSTLGFNGNQSLSAGVSFLTGNPAFSVFVVYRKTQFYNGSVFGWGDVFASCTAAGFYDDGTFCQVAFAGGNSYNVTAVPVNSWNVSAFIKAPGAINSTTNAYRNGTDVGVASNNSGNTPSISGLSFSIGSWANYYNATLLVGNVAEVVVLSVTASTSQRQQIEGYLAHKWGLASVLPFDHPYKNSAPTRQP